MEKILCPVDLKADTLNALEAAAHLAASHKAQLVLLHVFTDEDYDRALADADGDLEQVDLVQQDRLKSLERLASTLLESIPELKCNTLLRTGSAISTILDEARNLPANLIVMGSHGVHNVTEAMDGNHPVKVIERSPCPVLCVPFDTRLEVPSKVVYGSRMKPEDPDSIQRLLALLYPFGSRLEVVYVGDEDDLQQWQAHEQLIRSYIHYDRIRFHFVHRQGEAYQALNDFVLQLDAELLVLLTHQRNYFQRLFQKSVFKQITYFSDYPVLVFLEDHLAQAKS